MSNNFNIDSIQGIQELDDSAAQSCVGGSFKVSRYRERANPLVTDVAGDRATINLTGVTPITHFGVENTGGADSQNFQLTYRTRRGATLGTEYLTFGDAPSLYAGNGRMNTQGSPAVHDVVIQQYDAVDPGRLPLGIINDAMQQPVRLRGPELISQLYP